MEFKDPDIFGVPVKSEGTTFKDPDIFQTKGVTAGPPLNHLPSMRESLAEEVKGRPGAAFMGGMGTVLDNAALRLKQLVKGLNPQDEANVQANRDLLKASPWAMGGNVVGNAAALGPVAGPSIAGNAAVGAGAGFLGQPVMQGESGAGNAAMGGIFGGIGGAVGNLLTGAPVVARTPAVNTMLQNGVVPTVGQAAQASPSRVAQAVGRTEDKLTSVPLVGDMIAAARNRARDEFNRAAINRAMPPGQVAQHIGEEGIQGARQALGDAYEHVYGNAVVRMDPRFIGDIVNARNASVVPLSDATNRQYTNILQRYVFDRFPANGLPANAAKMNIEADLGRTIRELRRPTSSADERALGEAITAARDAFRDLMARNVGPRAGQLPPLNQAYANLQTVRNAAERGRAGNGVFTPFQLQTASRPGSEMRDFANAGQAALGSRVPDSGTAGRAFLGAALLGGGPVAAGTMAGAPMLGALGAAPLAYSRAGSRWLLGDLSPESIQALSPYVAQGIRGFEAQNR